MNPAANTSQLDPGVILAKATIRAAAQLGLTSAALSRVTGLSVSSITRVSSGGRPIMPDTKEGELAALLVQVFDGLEAMIGDDEKHRIGWLTSHNESLNGVPKDLIQSVRGLVRVCDFLDKTRNAYQPAKHPNTAEKPSNGNGASTALLI